MEFNEYLKIGFSFSVWIVLILLINTGLNRFNTTKQNRRIWLGFLLSIIFGTIFFAKPLWVPFLTSHPDAVIVFKHATACLWILSLSYLINNLIDYFLWNGIFLVKGRKIVPKILIDIVTVLLYLTTAAFILHFVFEQPVSGLLATSGLIAIIVGYSAKNTLSDVFAGLGLQLAPQFKEGEWIKIEDHIGEVTDINWRFLTLKTYYQNHLTIPNSVIAQSKITNYSRPTSVRGIILSIHVEADVSPFIMKKLILEVARECRFVVDTPEPKAALVRYSDNGNFYELWYYTTEPNEWEPNDAILSALWYCLDRNNIRSSLCDVRLQPKNKLIEEASIDIEKALSKVDILSILTKEEMQQVMHEYALIKKGPPEQILAEGSSNTIFYIILSGEVDIYISANKKVAPVASLPAGKFFGEMSVLTGEECKADVYVSQPAVFCCLEKSLFEKLTKNRPEIIDEITKIMVERQSTNQAKQKDADSENQDENVFNRLRQRMLDFLS